MLHMPVGELGDRMSNYELCVTWPAFFASRQRQADKKAGVTRIDGTWGG